MKTGIGGILILVMVVAVCGCESDSPPERQNWQPGDARIGNGYGGDAQEAQNWCWAACISTTLNEVIPDPQVFHPVTQPDLVRGLFGGFADDGASAESMVQLVDGKNYIYHFPYGQGVVVYTIHADLLPEIPTVQQLKPFHDDKHHRVILLLAHHAVILREIHYAESGENATVESWDIYDPFPGMADRTITGAEAANPDSDDHIRGGIVIGITRN